MNKKLLIGIVIALLFISTYALAAKLTPKEEAAFDEPSAKLTKETKQQLLDKVNATEYVISNTRYDNNCYYYSLKVGNWTDLNRELKCTTSDTLSDTELYSLAYKDTEFVLNQIVGTSQQPVKKNKYINDTQSLDVNALITVG